MRQLSSDSASHVSWRVELSVQDGQLDAFRRLSQEMADAASAEPGTLVFERFIDNNDGTVHIYERYVDANAGVIHLNNFRQNFAPRFAALVERKAFCVYGEPGTELLTLLTSLAAPMPLTPMPLLAGFSRLS